MAYTSDITKADRTSEAIDFPQVVLIDNISACNLKCSMCDHPNISKYRKVMIMDIRLYKKIIDEIALESPNTRVWEIFFGDPFLLKEMPDRIRYAKEKGLTDVVLNTNGVLMTEGKAKDVIKAGLDAIYVGIDAFSKEIYDKIRIKGDRDAAVKNVLKYRDLLVKFGNPTQKLFVQLVVSDINEHEVPDFKAFWNREGVNVKIRPKVSWAGLIDASNLLGNEQVERKPCYWVMRGTAICADGHTALCAVDIHGRVKCGNINDVLIKEVWNGQLKQYRQMHSEGRWNELPEMCRNCLDWQSAYAEFVEIPEGDRPSFS